MLGKLYYILGTPKRENKAFPARKIAEISGIIILLLEVDFKIRREKSCKNIDGNGL